MTDIVMYGIPNCDTIKKAATWFAKHKLSVQFHNYKTEGITAEKLKEWSSVTGWEILLNKKSTTWRKLPDAIKEAPVTKAKAIRLMTDHASLIKRPVVEVNGKVLAGFDETIYTQQFLT